MNTAYKTMIFVSGGLASLLAVGCANQDALATGEVDGQQSAAGLTEPTLASLMGSDVSNVLDRNFVSYSQGQRRVYTGMLTLVNDTTLASRSGAVTGKMDGLRSAYVHVVGLKDPDLFTELQVFGYGGPSGSFDLRYRAGTRATDIFWGYASEYSARCASDAGCTQALLPKLRVTSLLSQGHPIDPLAIQDVVFDGLVTEKSPQNGASTSMTTTGELHAVAAENVKLEDLVVASAVKNYSQDIDLQGAQAKGELITTGPTASLTAHLSVPLTYVPKEAAALGIVNPDVNTCYGALYSFDYTASIEIPVDNPGAAHVTTQVPASVHCAHGG